MDNIYFWQAIAFMLYTLGVYLFLIAAASRESGLKNKSKSIRYTLAMLWPFLTLWALLDKS